ncbi:peptidase inhibitor 16-like isoform X3 [Dysidea avara]|uniref:peptidase inhibitor 16-like isoform X3 n=1 Tax=Dysidea avara TaxID=196820 RepID=UPI00331D759B
MLSSVFTFPVLCLLVLTAAHLSVSQLTDEDKQLLLDLHNRARSMVYPIATNMEEMEWNDELAGVAQAYSTKCTTQPNGDRASQAKSFITVGENLGTISPPSSASYSALFETWFKGNLLYNYTTGKCIIKGICDSYKQLVWATSNQLGCGATRCSSVEGSSITGSSIVVVCNYGPSGNLEGKSPYMTGDSSCSNCPADKKSCVNNLCSNALSVSQLTDEDKQLLLDLHNRARSMVDPIATNMEEMEWNDELAGVAQAYSTKCTTQPNPNRTSQAPSFSTVGESSGVSMPPSSESFGQVVGFWFNGRHLYNYTTGQCFRDQFCDSYTQLVWATSNQVGCGATRCNPVGGFVGEALLLVCNYAPSEKLEGQSPYMTGDSSCSNCPDDKKSCVNNLCSNALSVSQLTDEDKQLLLDLHNRARSMVDPIATNMWKMEWNDELAGVAQAYSTKCSVQPNPDRASQAPSFSTVGENSGVSMPPSSESFGQVVGLWFDGRRLYNYTTGQCFRDKFCDPYTQLVWATSNQVGCGAT